MDIETTILRIRNEFLEMPGLRLNMPQAMRLWGLEKTECQRVVDDLIRAAFLKKTERGEIVRAA